MKTTTTLPPESPFPALERLIVASVLLPESGGSEIPPAVRRVLRLAPDAFSDARACTIATAILKAAPNGPAPDFGEVFKLLDEAHRLTAREMITGDVLPMSVAEGEAQHWLRMHEDRSAAQTLSEAAAAAQAHPAKAQTIARTAIAALQTGLTEDAGATARRWPSPLGEAAYIGFIGDFVRTVEHHTEADPAALLFQMLACFGNCVGSNAFFRQEWTAHNAREFVLVVGKSAKARKGTSWNIVREVFNRADPGWSGKRIVSGLGSGEGVVNAVRDPQTERDETGREISVTGAEDKRLMVVESEFASILSVSGREGSTLSEVLRNAWDSGNIQTLTRNNPLRATGAHISVIGHITESEFREKMKEVAIANGFGNRFLVCCARRARLLPEGGSLSDEEFSALAFKLQQIIADARKVSRMVRSEEARRLWREEYPKLSSDRAGSYGAMTSRAEAHVLRLSLLYALADCSSEISLAHLKAALECWRCCQESALYLWGDFSGGTLPRRIKDALADAGTGGLTKTQLGTSLGGRITAE